MHGDQQSLRQRQLPLRQLGGLRQPDIRLLRYERKHQRGLRAMHSEQQLRWLHSGLQHYDQDLCGLHTERPLRRDDPLLQLADEHLRGVHTRRAMSCRPVLHEQQYLCGRLPDRHGVHRHKQPLP